VGTRIEFDHYGDPSVLRAMSFEPEAPGPTEVLVRNEAIGVNPFDHKFIAGTTGGKPIEAPVVPGNEGAGVVEAVGSDVTQFAVGDAVVWRGYLGGFATHTVVAASKVYAKPAALSFAEAAALPVAAGTAWAAVNQAGVGPDDVLLVHAASGGVGSAAVQIAVALGARVIGTASTRNQDYVRQLGAEPVVYGPGLVEAVRALGQVTAIVDAVGTVDAVEASKRLLPGLARAISTAGAEGFTAVKSDAAAVPSVLALAAQGLLRSEITRSFELGAAAEALELSKTGHVRGKIVLLP
jgi:NADPH:quinone reductase-like Zn-dependent oxidoreductase